MSMLAQRKSRHNNRVLAYSKGNGKAWSEDPNGIGKKMLEKMGWSAGKGLGAKEDGMPDFLKVAYKSDLSGVGFKESAACAEQTKEFSELLRSLSEANSTTADDRQTAPRKISSLEEKSQSSRVRLHYKKFTRGKDLSRCSDKDLASIFGTKNKITVEVAEKRAMAVENPRLKNGGSMADYFKNKMAALKQRHGERCDEVGENGGEIERETTPRKKKKKKCDEESGLVNPAFIAINGISPPGDADGADAPEIEGGVGEEGAFADFEVRRKKKKKKSKTGDGTGASVFENVGFSAGDDGNGAENDRSAVFEVKRKKAKKKKMAANFESVGNADDCNGDQKKPSVFDNSAFNGDDSLNSDVSADVVASPFEVKRKLKRKKGPFENGAFDDAAADASAGKTDAFEVKRKAKRKKDATAELTTFNNGAFDDEDDENIPATPENNNFEVKRKKSKKAGVANPALEIQDGGRNSSLKRKKSVRFSDFHEERIIPSIHQQRQLELFSERDELFEINSTVIAMGQGVAAEGSPEGGGGGGIANRAFDLRKASLQENVLTFKENMDSCQAEVENDLNEAKRRTATVGQERRPRAVDFF